MANFRPTWAEVDLGALQENLRRFKNKISRRAKIMFVVKGNAYGHGALEVSRAAEQNATVSSFGVSSVEEGISLREGGIRLPILILGSLYPFESFQAAAEYNLTPTIASLEAAQRLVEIARKSRTGFPLRCHLKLDTGMARIGMGWPSGLQVVRYLSQQERVELEGVYTHFAAADDDRAYTMIQLRRFNAAIDDIRRVGIQVPLFHAANSAAALRYPQSAYDMVRPGLAIYGLYEKGFAPVLSLKSRIVFIKNVGAGTPISYSGTFKTRRASRIATLPIGYADGISRHLSNKAQVLVQGKKCPVVGTITMDMTMVDITKVSQARVGMEAVLIGRSGREEIHAGELAKKAGTISYETVTQLSARVPRVYLGARQGRN